MLGDESEERRKKYAYALSSRLHRMEELTSAGKTTNTSSKTSTVTTNSGKTQTSSYLSRLARISLKDAGCGSGSGKAGWISATSIDRSSPAANLESRLRRLEQEYKKGEAPTQPPQETPLAQQLKNAEDVKNAVCAIKKRVQGVFTELQSIEKNLGELEQKLS